MPPRAPRSRPSPRAASRPSHPPPKLVRTLRDHPPPVRPITPRVAPARRRQQSNARVSNRNTGTSRAHASGPGLLAWKSRSSRFGAESPQYGALSWRPSFPVHADPGLLHQPARPLLTCPLPILHERRADAGPAVDHPVLDTDRLDTLRKLLAPIRSAAGLACPTRDNRHPGCPDPNSLNLSDRNGIYPRAQRSSLVDLRDLLEAIVGGTYRPESELGGGMSRVILADETRLSRKVVIKVLPSGMADGVNVERFEWEIQLAVKLQHPYVAPVAHCACRAGPALLRHPLHQGGISSGEASPGRRAARPDQRVRVWAPSLRSPAQEGIAQVASRTVREEK